jgi:hypothetical protein
MNMVGLERRRNLRLDAVFFCAALRHLFFDPMKKPAGAGWTMRDGWGRARAALPRTPAGAQ